MPTINIKDITEAKIVRLVDLSEDSINKIAEAVVQKIVNIDFVKRGHWVTITNEPFADKYKCSECDKEPLIADCEFELTPYCPFCGAKMDEDAWQEPEINPCRGCVDYDGRGGCKSNGGCGVEIGGVEDEID